MSNFFNKVNYMNTKGTIILAVVLSVVINYIMTALIITPQLNKDNKQQVEYVDATGTPVNTKDVTFFISDCPHEWNQLGVFGSNLTLSCNKCGMIQTIRINKVHTYTNIPKEESLYVDDTKE